MDGQLPVLIVGAGPTGLMMACELARHGIPFRIIDKNAERTLSSNATWIQTLTIELFDHIGIANQFIEISNRCHGINLYINGKSLITIPLNYIESLYQFILMLPQSETERLLIEYLEKFKFKVERSAELINVKQNKNSVTSIIRHEDGSNEVIISNWLIACDGANSTVREKCKMFFPGEDIKEQFIVADSQIDSYMSKEEVHVFFNEDEIFAAFPMGDNRYRITANLHLPVQRKIYTNHEIIEMAQERAYGAYYVKSVAWISMFWVHSRVIKKMRDGLLFFAGDAAHIHSPAGGQGMNTGLQDAYNLAWKLALVIKGKAKPTLLNTYHAERYPIVNQIVKRTNQYTKMAINDNKFLSKLRQFAKKISRDKQKIAKKIAMDITQLTIQYQKSPIVNYKKISAKSPGPGQHALDVAITDSIRLNDYLRNTMHNVLLFAGNGGRNKLTKIYEIKNWLDLNYPDLFKTQIIAKEKFDLSDIILDVNGKVHERYHITAPSIYIIRPDNYIAYCSKNLDLNSIKKYVKKFLN